MSTRPTRSRARDESGVIAVLVALMAIVLLGIAALAVDMGNAYARKRLVQTEVDLAALAGGAKLPATDAASRLLAVEAVLDYLQRNATFGQEQDGWTAAQLLDGSISNGEVVFESDGRMRVTAPPATVNFGLAGALGFTAVDVNAAAVVQIGSPGALMPMWLPSSCAVGQVLGDTGPGGSSTPGPDTANPTPKDTKLGLGSMSVTTAAYGATVPVTVTLTNLPENITAADVLFTFGTSKSENYTVPAFPKTGKKDTTRTVTISVDTRVTNTSGEWRAWAHAKDGYSSSSLAFTVEGAGTLGCSTSSRGNFGQLDSPRKDGETKQTRYALNLAIGLDHTFQTYPEPLPSTGVCDSTSPAQLDDAPARDGRNCVNSDSGNDGPGLTDGLLAGVSGYPGRLATSPNGGCGRTPITFSKVTSAPINNDVLSCYLPTGYTNANIATVVGPGTARGVLSDAIFTSPRFVWVPVVGCSDRSCKGNLAVKSFASCFITDEGVTASKSSSDASSSNGITLNGGGTQISSVQLLCFDPAALPETTTSTTGGMPYLGSGTKVVSLVE